MLFFIIFFVVVVIFVTLLVVGIWQSKKGDTYLCDDVDGAVRGQLAMFETTEDRDMMKRRLDKHHGKF